jgi:hypothetical protein
LTIVSILSDVDEFAPASGFLVSVGPCLAFSSSAWANAISTSAGASGLDWIHDQPARLAAPIALAYWLMAPGGLYKAKSISEFETNATYRCPPMT